MSILLTPIYCSNPSLMCNIHYLLTVPLITVIIPLLNVVFLNPPYIEDLDFLIKTACHQHLISYFDIADIKHMSLKFQYIIEWTPLVIEYELTFFSATYDEVIGNILYRTYSIIGSISKFINSVFI
jgi:hypothetical protein